jgi:hypothetical protein
MELHMTKLGFAAIAALTLALAGCATATSGDMGKGAAIGGAIGAVVDIVD